MKRIDALKPYKGGNDALWRLHELNAIDKHRLLLTIALAQDYRWLDWTDWWFGMPWDNMPEISRQIIPMEHRAQIRRAPEGPPRGGPQMHMNDQITFVIAFNEPQIMQPEPVVPALVQFADAVEMTVAMFDDVV